MLLLAAKTLLDIRSIGPPEDIFGKVDTQEVNTQESYSNSLKQSNFLKYILENQTTDKIGEIILV